MENEIQTQEEIQDSGDRDVATPESAARAPSRLPLLLVLLAVLVWFGFQTFQLMSERSGLTQVHGNFETAMQESQKMRAQLQSLIARTAELAKQGNPSARTAVQELERKGIPINIAAQAVK